jgi:hypothetical protein
MPDSAKHGSARIEEHQRRALLIFLSALKTRYIHTRAVILFHALMI